MKVLNTLRGALLLAGILFLVVAARCVFTVETTVKSVAADTHTLMVKANADADETHRLLLEAGLTAREARLAATEERAYLGKWNKTADNANDLLVSLKATTDGVNQSQAMIAGQATEVLKRTDTVIAGLVPLEDNVNQEVQSLNKATADLDAAVSNPHINGTLAHLDGTVGNVDAMTTDVREKVHAMLHPKWTTRVWGVLQEVGVDAAKVLF